MKDTYWNFAWHRAGMMGVPLAYVACLWGAHNGELGAFYALLPLSWAMKCWAMVLIGQHFDFRRPWRRRDQAQR